MNCLVNLLQIILIYFKKKIFKGRMPVEILEIMKIENILDKMEKGIIDKEILNDFPELDAKMQEQEKLKYRLNLLKRAANESADGQINSEAKKPQILKMQNPSASSPKYIFVENYGDSIIEKLNDEFSRAIDKAFLKLAFKVNIKETNNPKFGDYQFDACIQISRYLSAGKNKISPQEVAQKILENFEKIDFVEKLEIVNVYINIFVSKEHLGRKAAELCANGLTIPKIKKRHVVVDYSSPNIAKQMHVGHLRSTIIGESISRLLEFVGFSVLRINHIGDWGTQFGMLIAYLQEKFPNYLNEPPPIQDLQTFYKESKIKFDGDNEFKNRAYQCVVKLQNFDSQIVKAWQMICDISRKEFESIYEQLDIRNLVERGESFYQSRMQKIVEDLEKAGILVEEEGRKLFFPPDCTIPLTVVKSDGGYTYDTSDLATIKQRLFEEKADWVLYVVDKGQSVHLETIYAAARQLGWYDPTIQRVEHIQFGLVLGEDKKKFKTRSGDTVKLQDLMDEGVRRSEEKLRTKVNEKEFSEEELKKAAKSLAFGCIKYSDLSQSRIGDYVFSFDRMLDDRGNTAVYLLYAYTRIRSIARNACQVTREQINEYLKTLDGGILPLDHPKEIRLTKQILKFSDCLLFALETLQLNKICDYIYELSTSFSDFYKDCYVVSKIQSEDGSNQSTKINYNRLVLCEVTADIMQRCFHILGITPIDRM